ncbi:MAG: flagellar hook-basal body complex protein FliE [Actinomycetes bacterium]
MIPALSAVSAVSPTGYLDQAGAVPASAAGGDFAASLTSAVDSIQGLQSTSSALAVQAVSGDLADVHDYTIAATEAAVTLELAAAVRNRAVEAFTEIMRMQA